MPRYLIVAGIDFGTSFTKVVLRDNNTPGSKAVVVPFPGYPDGLLPSLVGLQGSSLTPPAFPADVAYVPYLKMLAAHIAGGKKFEDAPIRTPAALKALLRSRTDMELARDLLAFYFANVIAATEDFIRSDSPWRDFDFSRRKSDDFLVFQLGVPTGLLADKGKTERLFREAFIAGYELRRKVSSKMATARPHSMWSKDVDKALDENMDALDKRFEWQCLLYPEVAAAVQTVFRSPNAKDGLYITMDVGAGTVDLNAFNRFSGHPGDGQTRRIANLDYYSAIVCPLGVQNLKDPHGAVEPMSKERLRLELRTSLKKLYDRALVYQPNLGDIRRPRTWDRATLFIFGGGARFSGYRNNFVVGLEEAGIRHPQAHNLPQATDISCPPGIEFGRFAVAYGLSFFRPSWNKVSLPHELETFAQLYPQLADQTPKPYGFNWDD
jgi:hypothetical protein